MELKVWVDGIQRVVCGLTEDTTCQDVVVALALATKQTGRFTLIEKWRNNERFVSPNEKLLDALAKWGEYTNDVHFLLRKSPAKSSTYHHHHHHHHSKSHHSSSGSNNNNNNNHNHDHSHHRLTNGPLDRDKRPKSPTSSASLKGTPSPPALNLTDDKRTSPSPSSSSCCPSRSLVKLTTTSTNDQSSSSRSQKLLPNASTLCQSTPCEDGSSNGANNHSSLYASCQRSSPSKCNKDTNNSPPRDLQSPQLLGGTCSHPSHPINLLSHSKEDESSSSSHSSPSSSSSSSSSSTHSNGQSSHCKPMQVDDESPPSKRSTTNSDGKDLIISPNDSPVRPPERPRDPLRIVSSYQSNALISQDLISNCLQREIEESVAGKSVDTRASVTERLSPEEIELKTKQANDLFAEIAQMECNKAACEDKIQLLTKQIEEEQSLLEMKRIQEEEQRRVTELKKALEKNENILTQKQLEEGHIDDQLRRVNDELQMKKEKVEQLENELRKENLNALSIEPTECSISNLTTDASTSAFIKLHSDIKRPLSSVLLGTGFYNRIGSTRKIMGYPRSLQTTAPTKKNPQGVWV